MPRRRLPAPVVRAGQVWGDRRQARAPSLLQDDVVRTFRVIALDLEAATVKSDLGRTGRIQLARLRPTKRGYFLINDVPSK